VSAALAAVGLEESGGHLIEELSGGQQQRVAVARALASRPAVLLADEPTSELDHVNRERVLALLHDLAGDGCTVLMATHDPEAAAQAAAEVHLDEGRVVRAR
jgi:putative ABC transport system ATP-binding protein